jgi:type IV pilus assembly protein PilC
MAYAYRARDSFGKVIEGTIAAVDAAEATQQLRRDGLAVLDIADDDNDPPLLGGRISRRDIANVTTQLAVMVDTGITLSSALQGLMSQEQNPKLKHLMQNLQTAVEGGSDFSSALQNHPQYFDPTYIALVRASEASGTLGEMLDRIAEYLRTRIESRAKVRAAMTYPAVIATLAIGVTVFLLTYIMPKFEPLFSSKKADLPQMTVVMMAASRLLVNYWYAWLLGLIAAIVGFVIWKRTDSGKRTWDGALLYVPLLGPLSRKIILSRSISTLGTMIAAGVSTLDALRLCGESAGNHVYGELWENVRERVMGGDQICEALSNNPLVPGTLVQMIASGEQSGRLDEVLQRVSTFYDREVETSLKTATSLIEPIMIGIMGAVVGTIGLSLLLPIFSLSRPSH